MKTLTKIRLINWHYFENETIKVKNNILLTGTNAAGKSTILDAVSYVLTAGDQNFNLAANEKGKRDLRSYCKCKIGSLDQEYLRDYDLTSHICLEFHSDKGDKTFCLGAIIDILGNIQPPKTSFYIIDGEMNDEFFINENGMVKTSSEFKKEKITDLFYQTRKDARSAFRTKMGGISDKYFSLLPKALAFKPIADVKDYIYHHLLEEKEIDVKNIQESIRAYKEFETILKTTKAKIEDLEKISNNYYTIKDLKQDQVFYEYMIKDLNREDNKNKIESKKKQIRKIEIEREDIKNKIISLESQVSIEDDKSKEMYASLSQDKDFKANEIYEKDIKRIQFDLKISEDKISLFNELVEDFKTEVSYIEGYDQQLYKSLNKLNFEITSDKQANDVTSKINEALLLIDKYKDDCAKKEAELNIRKSEIVKKINEMASNLASLAKNTIPYRREIVDLRMKMEEHLYDLYKEKISVHILSEIIDVSDESWKDTVENFLNQQRFTLIVHPKYYDDCLDCYNKYKSPTLYGVNLLNTKKIQDFTSYQTNSLASIIVTDNKDARCYCNYLMGSMIMVDDVHDLDRYNQAITKSGMVYRGFTTRFLNPNIEKPFIGVNAGEVQARKYSKISDDLKQEFALINERLTLISNFKSLISELKLTQIRENIKYVTDSINLNSQLSSLIEKKNSISLVTVNELKNEYQKTLDLIKELHNERDSLQMELGIKKQTIDQIDLEMNELIEENNSLDTELSSLEAINYEFKNKSSKLFEEEFNKGLTKHDIQTNLTKDINEKLSQIKSLESGLVVTQINYISKYNRPFSTGFDSMDSYLTEQDRLIKSELVKYENKVRDSREEAEKLFKEDFLSKLRNYILEAQEEISKINETLEKIQFGNDKYQFVFPKSKEFGAIYDMIIQDMNQNGGYSIFNEEFERKYSQELDELFTNLSLDEENSQGNLSKYTDYRTYMDYDIKITAGDATFYFSQISKEKSGGETQIPFYVAIIASFVRLFDKAEKSGLDDSIGLILFDEVFDKMDSSRINAMMDFISRLNVQIIFACPPDKMETLSKFVSTQIVVCREGTSVATFVQFEK